MAAGSSAGSPCSKSWYGTIRPNLRYIFGQAKAGFPVVGTKDDLLLQRDFLSALINHVRGEIKAGKSRDAIVSAAGELKGFPEHDPLTDRVLAPTYDELTQGA